MTAWRLAFMYFYFFSFSFVGLHGEPLGKQDESHGVLHGEPSGKQVVHEGSAFCLRWHLAHSCYGFLLLGWIARGTIGKTRCVARGASRGTRWKTRCARGLIARGTSGITRGVARGASRGTHWKTRCAQLNTMRMQC